MLSYGDRVEYPVNDFEWKTGLVYAVKRDGTVTILTDERPASFVDVHLDFLRKV